MTDFKRCGLVFAALILLCGTVFAQNSSSTTIFRSGGGSPTFNSISTQDLGGTVTSTGTLTTTAGTFLVGNSGTWVTSDAIEIRLATAPRVTLAQVKMSRKPVPAAVLATSSYMKLAKSINLKSPAVDYSQMGEILADHGFQVYDFAKVDNYLYHEALKQGTQMRWVWKPMREEDGKALAESGAWGTSTEMGRMASSVYAHAIPERVLEKVECLLTEMPDAIFFVSDYEVVKPDPFLAVSTRRMLQDHKIFIVDQWDEPGFKDSPKPIVEPLSSPIPVRMAQSKDGR